MSAEELHSESLPSGFGAGRLAELLWRQEGVIALWLGGSFARGAADKYSDLDLRLCVTAETVARWDPPDFDLLFGGAVVGSRHGGAGPPFFYQVVLANGHIVDLWIQTMDQQPPQDYVLLIGCRDEEFRRRLVSAAPEPAYAPEPAEGAVVGQIVTDFWIDSLKHAKVLSRDLDLIAQVGVGLEHAALMRLWHVLATGHDTGAQRPTIHGLTAITRHIDALPGGAARELLGLPLRDRAEVRRAAEANREEVARVGRLLSERLDFPYPARLEDTVRATWADFLAASDWVS